MNSKKKIYYVPSPGSGEVPKERVRLALAKEAAEILQRNRRGYTVTVHHEGVTYKVWLDQNGDLVYKLLD